MYVGTKGRRVVIATSYLRNKVFQVLLVKSSGSGAMAACTILVVVRFLST